jgi:transposase
MKDKTPKQQEIELRRIEVYRLHLFGYTLKEISEKFNVDMKTISRDIQENRKEVIKQLVDGKPNSVRNWLRDQLADYIGFADETRRVFYEQSKTFKTEASKSKALWSAVQVTNQKIEVIKSLMLSCYDVEDWAEKLNEQGDDDYEDY